MTLLEANQIAQLLNDRNELDRQLSGPAVWKDAKNYRYEIVDGAVIACVARRKVQWYQWELYHLSVASAFDSAGHARRLYTQAMIDAEKNGARLLQCTIREGNSDSESFFTRQGFGRVSRFLNARTRNVVGVWQKVLAPPDRAEQP